MCDFPVVLSLSAFSQKKKKSKADWVSLTQVTMNSKKKSNSKILKGYVFS